MNNAPKFRFWHIVRKEMMLVDELQWINDELLWVCADHVHEAWCFKAEEVTLMQWTGLQDVSGSGVFEGDVIVANHPGHKWKGTMFIKKNIEGGRWELAPASNCLKNVRIFNAYNVKEQRLEVIGNIYENENLLA